MSVTLLSYAAGDPIHSANQRALVASARQCGGFDTIRSLGPDASAPPARANRTPGAGYWHWKPRIILAALESAAPDDLVVYLDAGARLRRPFAPLFDLARRHDAVLFANDYFNAAYTKRDAFILTGTDTPACHGARQLDAALMLWRNTPAARQFVARWLEACTDPRALTDAPGACGAPELPQFRAHRHDQALLSLLLWRDHRSAALAVLPRRVKYRFIQHHRRRISWLPIPLWHATHDGPWECQQALRRRRFLAQQRRRRRAPTSPPACPMQRLPHPAIYRDVDRCLAFLRDLPPAAPPAGAPTPVHFFWVGNTFGAKPALCLRSFLATQDPQRVRPRLWFADAAAHAAATTNPHLAPLLPALETRVFDLAAYAADTPLAAAPWLPRLEPAARSDVARLLILFRHGGYYSDLDALFLRDLGPLATLHAGAEVCFQWSATAAGTNAFAFHAAGSAVLGTLLTRTAEIGSAHPRPLLDFRVAPPALLLLPVAAFSPLWLVADGHARSAFAPFTRFDEFFAPRTADDPRRATLDTFFPGAFTYHWHGRWHLPEHPDSWAGQLAHDIAARLADKYPALSAAPPFGR
jgi:hypothetical protein